ncbi:response regulator transcription factor [Marinobacter xiaoshiensis]|uniref:Response regulator transcription factor n=1 Tax=Marinobacter xiaoshiensis TaxID=3073652 RepID=A0ABU2HJD0_9GAMM|nr:response regulator transcription factor [Marinobacter sp. F60267]MDS1311174.1 response regulator transcription factor [Marinobacter sp. F60267]
MSQSNRKLRLYVTIGQRLFRDSLLFQLLLHNEIDLVGESESGIDTLKNLESARPGVLIIEENLPDNDGLTIAEHALSEHPTIAVLLISDTPVSANRLVIYLEAGIKAVVSKHQPIQDLVKTLFYIRNGQVYVGAWQKPDAPSQGMLNAYNALSGREREVARLIASRTPIKDIAEQLGVSCKTVHSYKDRIFVKLGFERLPELILFMKRHHNGAAA